MAGELEVMGSSVVKIVKVAEKSREVKMKKMPVGGGASWNAEKGAFTRICL